MCPMHIANYSSDLLSLTTGAGGFLVAQLVLIGRDPSHWLFIPLMACSASWNAHMAERYRSCYEFLLFKRIKVFVKVSKSPPSLWRFFRCSGKNFTDEHAAIFRETFHERRSRIENNNSHRPFRWFVLCLRGAVFWSELSLSTKYIFL